MKNYLVNVNGVNTVISSSQPVLNDVICEVPAHIEPGDYDYLIATPIYLDGELVGHEVTVDTEARDLDPDYEYKKKMRS